MDEHLDLLRKVAQAVIDKSGTEDYDSLAHSATLDSFDVHVTPDVVIDLLDRIEGLQAALRDANVHIDELQGRLSDALDEDGRLALNQETEARHMRT